MLVAQLGHVCVLGLSVGLSSSGPALAQGIIRGDDRAAGRLEPGAVVPADVDVAITIRDALARMRALRTFTRERELTDSALGELLRSNDGLVKAQIGLAAIAAMGGMDSWTAVGSLLGEEAVIALKFPDEGKPRIIGVSRFANEELGSRLVDAVRMVANQAIEDAFIVKGVRVERLGDDVLFAEHAGGVFVSNDKDLIQGALVSVGRAGGLAQERSFRSVRDRVAGGAAVWMYVRPELAGALLDSKGIGAMLPNPLAGVLLGGWHHALRHADGVGAWIEPSLEGVALEVRLSTDGPLPASHRGFAPDGLAAPTFRAEEVHGFVGEMRFSRDWEALFAERESLLTVSAAGQFVEFANGLSTLMGGLDFIENVMGRIDGPLRVIAAEQSFDGAVPTPRLPAFALIAPIDVNEQMHFPMRVESAALSALSFANFQAMQNNTEPMVLSTAEVHGNRVVTGRFLPPGEMGGEPHDLGIRHNFAPAIGMIGDRLVITTSMQMMEEISGLLARGGRAVGAADGDRIHLDMGALVRELDRNEQELVANRMIEQNISRTRAASDVRAFLGAMGMLESVSLTSSPASEDFTGRIEVTVRERQE